MKRNIVIHGCYNNANYGDILIADLLRSHIKKNLGISAACPWLLSVSDGKTRKGGRGWRDVFSAELAIFGGGGYFQDSVQMMRRYYLPAKIWRAKGIPYVVLGVGVGPNLTGLCAERVRYICEGAEWINVRDIESKRLLISLGVEAGKVKATTDLVMGLAVDDIPPSAGDCARNLLGNDKTRRRRIALHFPDFPGERIFTSSYPFIGRAPDPKKVLIVKTIAEALKNQKDIEVIWLEFDRGRSTSQALRSICKEYLPDSNFIPYVDHWVNTAILREVDAVISTRLHVGIVAWALGVPCAAFATHGKTSRFYDQVGRMRYCSRADVPLDVLQKWIAVICDNYQEISHQENQLSSDLRASARENYRQMISWIREKC